MSNKPAWAGEYGPSYDDIVASWGYEVAESEYLGSYQGDAVFVLRNGELWGLVVIGYGSCSGCDHLQAITPWNEEEGDWGPVEQFREELRGDVHWEPSKEALVEWIHTQPENHWWAFDYAIKRWLNQHLDAHFDLGADDPSW